MDVVRGSLRHGGRRRTYTTVGTGGRPGPLVVALHGTLQRGATLRRFAGGSLDGLVPGSAVVYPDAYRRRWNDGRRSLQAASRRAGIDDVGFVRELIDRLVAEGVADPARVLLVGYSNGGQLAIRIAHEDPAGLVGIVTIGAARPVDDDFIPLGAPASPLRVLLIHGTADPIVPYGGGPARIMGRPQGENLSAEATARYFAARNSIASPGVEGAGDGVRRLDFAEPDRLPVRLVTVEGGGHVVPNPVTRPRFVGPSVRTVSAAEEIRAFFGSL